MMRYHVLFALAAAFGCAATSVVALTKVDDNEAGAVQRIVRPPIVGPAEPPPRAERVDGCATGVIETIAGTGEPGFSGDGGPAAEATLRWPNGIAVGPDGSLYIADTGNQRIRRVDAEGVITTVAGGGAGGYSGDGGPATEARLNEPFAVLVDNDGRVVIADQRNARVRVVDAAGTIATLAGNGDAGYAGDGGPATEGSLNGPTGLALDLSGSILIVDAVNGRVRRVDAAGNMTTVAGKGWCSLSGIRGDGGPAVEAAFCTPTGIAVGPDGSLYIAERANRVRRVDRNGVITTVAGDGWPGCVNCQGRFAGDDGPAVEASLNGPIGLAGGEDGSLFIADSGNKRIRKVNPEGAITTIAGNGQEGGVLGTGIPAAEAGLGWPVDVAVAADGSLYIVDSGNHAVYRVWWRPCDPEVAKAKADDLRAKAGESPRLWREAAELYLIAESWEDALAAAEQVLALAPEADQSARMSGEVLVARVYAAKRDDHEARRRLMRILARAADPGVLREAADALVELYMRRGERDQAISTLNDLRLRTNHPGLIRWVDQRLKNVAGE